MLTSLMSTNDISIKTFWSNECNKCSINLLTIHSLKLHRRCWSRAKSFVLVDLVNTNCHCLFQISVCLCSLDGLCVFHAFTSNKLNSISTLIKQWHHQFWDFAYQHKTVRRWTKNLDYSAAHWVRVNKSVSESE